MPARTIRASRSAATRSATAIDLGVQTGAEHERRAGLHHVELLGGDVGSVGPSQRVCSRPTLVSTCTLEGITLVAS